MKKKKKNEERYVITPKGLLLIATADSKDTWDELALHCYRNNFNAILIDANGGEFIKVEKGDFA